MKTITKEKAKTKKEKDLKDKDVSSVEKSKKHPLIKGVRITEKSSLAADKGRYTFNVEKNANKNEIKKAVEMIYKVTPVNVKIIKIAAKTVTRKGKMGIKSSGKKAIVHLKKGDKIEFI